MLDILKTDKFHAYMAHERFWREKCLATRRYAAAVDVETDQPRAVSQKMTDGAILLIPVARHLLCCPPRNLRPKTYSQI